MLTNTKKPITKQLGFALLLLATTVSGHNTVSSQNCRSFQDVADFDTESNVLSAPGFVKSLTIPSGKGQMWGYHPHENATAIVIQHGEKVATPRFLDFNKTLTVRLPGTGVDWAGYNESSYEHVEDVGFDGFMSYFADNGNGLVFELENHSTLELDFWDGEGNETTYIADPAKMFKSGSKVAVAVFREVEMKITIPSANVLSISMDRDMAQDNYFWIATEDTISGSGFIPPHASLGLGPNQCFEITTTPDAPTRSPTQPTSGAVARRIGVPIAAFSTLVAAALVALW